MPTLYDDVLQVTISKLKEWGYLTPNQYKTGTLTWSRNGNKIGAISIIVNMSLESPCIEFDYMHQGTPVNYKVLLVSIPSNLGIGRIWYFLCPHTLKRCRILYSVGQQFLHREAFRGCIYEIQTQSQKSRRVNKLLDIALGGSKARDQIYGKHFKTHYAGRPTKRYLRLMNQVRQSEQFSARDLDRLIRS